MTNDRNAAKTRLLKKKIARTRAAKIAIVSVLLTISLVAAYQGHSMGQNVTCARY